MSRDRREYTWPYDLDPRGPQTVDEVKSPKQGDGWFIPVRMSGTPVYRWSYSFDPDEEVKYMTRSAPNWFNRLLQRWLLGIYWRRAP